MSVKEAMRAFKSILKWSLIVVLATALSVLMSLSEKVELGIYCLMFGTLATMWLSPGFFWHKQAKLSLAMVFLGTNFFRRAGMTGTRLV